MTEEELLAKPEVMLRILRGLCKAKMDGSLDYLDVTEGAAFIVPEVLALQNDPRKLVVKQPMNCLVDILYFHET